MWMELWWKSDFCIDLLDSPHSIKHLTSIYILEIIVSILGRVV